MKYANGREVKLQDAVIGRDSAKNIVGGFVIGMFEPRAQGAEPMLRTSSSPIPMPAETALHVEDAYDAAMNSLKPASSPPADVPHAEPETPPAAS